MTDPMKITLQSAMPVSAVLPVQGVRVVRVTAPSYRIVQGTSVSAAGSFAAHKGAQVTTQQDGAFLVDAAVVAHPGIRLWSPPV